MKQCWFRVAAQVRRLPARIIHANRNLSPGSPGVTLPPGPIGMRTRFQLITWLACPAPGLSPSPGYCRGYRPICESPVVLPDYSYCPPREQQRTLAEFCQDALALDFLERLSTPP